MDPRPDSLRSLAARFQWCRDLRRALIVLALTAVLADPARAGHSCPAYFALPHVVYGPGWLQGGQYDDMTPLLRARGLALLLEERVAGMIGRGQLADKRLHVDGHHGIGYPNPPLRVSQNHEGYFIEGAQALDLRNLLRTIDYFTSPEWTSFHPEGDDSRDNARLLPRFERMLDRAVAEPDLDAFRARRVVVYEVGDLDVIDQDGALSCEVGGTPLAVQLVGFLPVQVGDRYVLQTQDAIVAVEKAGIVARHAWAHDTQANPPCPFDGMTAWAHPAWVNLSCAGSRRAVLTYSLAANRFLPVDVELVFPARAPALRIGLFIGECG